jgi:Coenzyme PQQ synthesis protein D (PqqD)
VIDGIGSVGPLRKRDGLEIHLVDEQCVVYDTSSDTIHYLNPTAALVLEFCDGHHAPSDIAVVLQEAYQLPEAPLDEVTRCLKSLRDIKFVG